MAESQRVSSDFSKRGGSMVMMSSLQTVDGAR